MPQKQGRIYTRSVMNRERTVTIYDTTLRDGAQTVGISFSLQDKIRIAIELDRLNVDYIEGGWPGSNPKDDLFFQEIRKEHISHAKIAAFGSTRRPRMSFAEDTLLQSLVNSRADVLTIVAKTWDFQVEKALGITLPENIELITDTVKYLKDAGFAVFMDAEHFFDGYRENSAYSLECAARAREAGADMIVLCDTNGGTLPHEVQEITSRVAAEITFPLGVHFHNDTGVALANSLAAVRAGAVSVQGTVNGYGERCGNCDIMTVIPNLVLKMGYNCESGRMLSRLTETSRCISEIANLAHNERAPYVGANAFAHKGGIHVSAIRKDTRTYEHCNPEAVGNQRKILVSELSGKSNIEFKLHEMGIADEHSVKLSRDVLQKIKKLEDQGYQFEAAEGSFELIIREATGEYRPFFNLKGFRVMTEMKESGALECEATIKVEVDGRVEHTASNGDGPVEALDNALRKALEKFYPEITHMHLSDYKVRVLNEEAGTGSTVRVLIDQSREGKHWGTVGVSPNIIEASWQALVDGIEYMLFKFRSQSGN